MDSRKMWSDILSFSKARRLPSKKQILSAAQNAFFVLRSEDSSYREWDKELGAPGGLLDFTRLEPLPVVVVPDIHARPDFILNILNFTLTKRNSGINEEMKIIDALCQNKVRVVCVGDILHSEGRARGRWILAWEDFDRGVFAGEAMRAEMREGLAALIALMKCKAYWPKNFHCLKGNHENIANELGEGNRPFRKFASEGRMVFEFMKEVYGEEILSAVYDFEKALPLAAAFQNIFVSHAEPLEFFDREQIANGLADERVVYGLTWTANDKAQEGSVQKMLSAHCAPQEGVEPRYLGGHRPVPQNYLERQGGLYVQIHNPGRQNIAIARPEKTFNPKRNILSVAPKAPAQLEA